MAADSGVVTANLRGSRRKDPPSTWMVAAMASLIAAKSKSSSVISVGGDDVMAPLDDTGRHVGWETHVQMRDGFQ